MGYAIAFLMPMVDQPIPAEIEDRSVIMLITVPPELAIANGGIPV